MNGASGWGPPKDKSLSGCPGSLTLKNLQESEMIRMSLRNASLTENYQFCSTRKKLTRRNCDDWKSIWQALVSADQHPAFPVYTNPFITEANVSNDGLRTVLSQEQDGRVRPTSYASCALRETYRNMENYSSRMPELRELLDLKSGPLQKSSELEYLISSMFTVLTDNNPPTPAVKGQVKGWTARGVQTDWRQFKLQVPRKKAEHEYWCSQSPLQGEAWRMWHWPSRSSLGIFPQYHRVPVPATVILGAANNASSSHY